VTVDLSTFAELLMTTTMAQKINKSRWVDPSGDWGQSGAYKMPRCRKNSRKQGEMGNRVSPEGRITISFSILSPLKKMGVPESGKSMTMNSAEQPSNVKETYCEANSYKEKLAAEANGQLNVGVNCQMCSSNCHWTVGSWVNCQRCSWIRRF